MSELGGYVNALGEFQLQNGAWDIVGRGSFSATYIELITSGVSFEKGASNSNLDVIDNWIKVKKEILSPMQF